MHEVRVKGILSAQNGMNIYRGCSHGCIYCDARSTCYQMNHLFEDIEIKINAPELLEDALRRKRKKCMIGTGAMSDPYMPIEKKYGLMRRCLEIIDRYGFGATVQTKSDLVLRDLDLLKRINAHSKCVVQMTLTTADPKLCSILEPNVCNTQRRAEVLEILRDEGIPAVVWFTPVLPFINDTRENVEGILDICIRAKVKGIITFGGLGLTLRDGDRQYYYRKLDEHFPGVKQKYIRTYAEAYQLPLANNAELMPLIYDACGRHGIMTDTDAIFVYLHAYEDKYSGEQLRLFD
ncbi:MAG: radical SAM protein [Clostridia bacterium]|nr:radical SAM protein [Clostridia bacterium]